MQKHAKNEENKLRRIKKEDKIKKKKGLKKPEKRKKDKGKKNNLSAKEIVKNQVKLQKKGKNV